MAEAAAPEGKESFIEEIAETRSMGNRADQEKDLSTEEIAEVGSSMGNKMPSLRSIMRRNISGIFNQPPSQFNGEEYVNADGKDDAEEALHWTAIEKLPSDKRMRAAILKEYDENGAHVINRRVVDVGDLKPMERHLLIEKLVTDAEQDNEKFLRKLKDRIDRVGIELPTVEVRYENLNVDAKCHVGSRALPTLWNVATNILEGVLETMHLSLSKKAELPILKDVNGVIKPSRITLLLGPPGCGKTTFLLALAGKLDPALKMRGNTLYNGFQLNEFIPQTTSAYISQYDLHFAEMTVRETFDFSARCQGVGTSYDLLFEIREREKAAGILPEADIDTYMKATAIEGLKGSLQTDYILKILGLNICADIIIGDAMTRGISGGQRKRVTTGEIIMSPMKTLFMDEISTGLDSSTTFQVVKCLQQVAHIKQATIVMSLLQPAPETFNLFDDVIIMSEGQIVYHGPRDHVLEFFEYCGFMCPERKDIADFLQEVTSRKNQELYWEDREKPYRYISTEQFSQKFKQFHVGQKLTEELSKPFDKSKGHEAALSFTKYSLTKWELFKACFDREWLLFKRNSFLHIFKATQLVIVAIIAMSLFYRTHMQVDIEHGNYYLGSLFFALTTMTFLGLPEIPMTIRRLPVFFKQRDLYFYPAWAYTLPGILLKIPQSLFDALIWTSITYYGIGYSPEAGRFFRQFLVWFCVSQTAAALFRATSAVCRSIVVASTGGSLLLVVVGVFSGFLIPRSSIPIWCRWVVWISPMYYGETAITVNEFLAPRWRKLTSQNKSLGIEVLESHDLFHEDYFYWIGFGSLIGLTVLLNVGYTLALTYLNPIGKPQVVLSREKLANIQYSQGDRIFDDLDAKSNTISSSSTEGSKSTEVQLQDFTAEVQLQDFTRGGFRIDSSSTMLPGAKRGMILSFQPLAISFQNIQYFVDMPAEMKERGEAEKRLHLLKDITGVFRPGVLTALMGVSGAGKTTLMDVLSGRKTGGLIEGDIRISGFPKVQETFTRISGYCEQNDIHSPQVTVHESLLFSSWLRLAPEIDSKTKKNFVSQVMEMIELDGLKDSLVGNPGVNGLSIEQRKRLTIAVELVTNPSIIFMDEPTSGLDARAAAIVMRAVRNIVDTGRTVVCTIHQPSIDIFEAFDELLLMKRGGEIIYSGALGHHSENMIKYFEAIPGVPNIKDKYNPATWMLEVTSTGAEQRLSIDFAQIYKESSLFWENNELVKELCTPAPDAKDLYFPDDYAQNAWKQFTTCLWKQIWAYWRSPGYNLVRLTFTSFSALLFGIIYWQQGTKINDEEDLLKMMGGMYAAMLFIGINNASSVQPFVDVERKVFYREKAARLYSPIVYALAQVVVELPYTLFQTIIYGIITYSAMGFHWSGYKFFWYLFVTFCTLLCYTYCGMMTVAISPNSQVAAIIASAFYNIFNLFSGFLIPRPQFPGWWLWYYWICPLSWTLNGLMTSQYGDLRKKISVEGKPQQAIEDFLKDYFGFQRDFLDVVAAVLAIFPVLFALSFCISINILNFQKR